jgi:arylformamidase
MMARLDWRGREIGVDLAAGVAIAIPLDPHGPQPSFFAHRPAAARPLQSGDFVGDVRRGGSCNAELIELAPHCHGTHTECIGHVLEERRTVQETIYATPVLAGLASVAGTPAGQAAEHYPVPLAANEPLITRAELEPAVGAFAPAGIAALVIRTHPNGPEKRWRDYAESPAYPLLSSEAVQWLAAQPLQHLLLDTPSLDRGADEGRLANHRAWWGLDGSVPEHGVDPERRSVTEMLYVPDALADGLYWLHLELSPLVSDATPSRPVLYPVVREAE